MQSIRPRGVSVAIGVATVFLLTCVMMALTTPNVQATPQLAKGKPCNTCHEGAPPTKSNVKK